MLQKVNKKASKPVPTRKDSLSVAKKPIRRSKPVRPVHNEGIKKEEHRSKGKETKSREPATKRQPEEPKKEQKKEPEKEKKKKRGVIRTVTDPKKDPAFQKALREISESSDRQEEHPAPETKQAEIEDAAKVSVREQKENNDRTSHYESIEKSSKVEEKQQFKAETFKRALKAELKKLEQKLPKDSDSAKKFKKEKPLEKLKEDVNDKIVDGKEKATGGLQKDAEAKKPPESGIQPVQPKEVKLDETGAAPALIQGKSAVPKPKHSSEISMEEEHQKLDDTMAQNGLTETQLANSNEPTFIAALDSKTEAQKATVRAPLHYRAKEKKILAQASGGAEASGNVKMGKMFVSRIKNFNDALIKQHKTKDARITKKRELNRQFEEIYNRTKRKVTEKLNALTPYIEGFFEKSDSSFGGLLAKSDSVPDAKRRFERNVERKLDDIYGVTVIDDYLFGEDTEAIEKVFREEKQTFIEALDKIFDKIAEHITSELNGAIDIISQGRKESQDLYEGLSKEEQDLAKDSYDTFNDRYSDLEGTVRDKEKELVQSLAQQYKKNVDSLRESFDKIKESVSSSWVEKAVDAVKEVADTIKKLGEMIRKLVSGIAGLIPKILEDPIGFAKMLFGAVKEGIELFKTNIKKHLIGGFIKWLTGAMGPMGITIPENIFSLKGIFSLVMQILGLGWDFIRKKAVKLFGEPAVKVMEKSFEMFKIFKKEGIKGIWKYLKEKFNDLKETVIGEIKTMLITQVLIAGTKWLVGLFVPGGAFIKAAIAIKDMLVAIVESAMMIIPVMIKAIKAVASGNLKGVVKAVEEGLAALVVVVINIFAKILGLGGLAKKVQKIVKKVRKRIDRAVDKLLDKARKAFNKLFGRGKIGAKKGAKKEKPVNKKIDKTLGKELKFTAAKENHRLWITTKGGKVKVMVASRPKTILSRLEKWEKKIPDLNKEDSARAVKYIKEAKELYVGTVTEAEQEQKVIKEAILKQERFDFNKYDKERSQEKKDTMIKEGQLKVVLSTLFNIFGYEITDLSAEHLEKVEKRHCLKEVKKILKNPKIRIKEEWSQLVTELKKYGLYDKMLEPGSDFYEYLKTNLNENSDKKQKLYLNEVNKTKIKNNLDNYMSINTFEDGKKEISKVIKEYLDTKGQKEGEHTEYKPQIESISIKNQVMEIVYNYKNDKHQDKMFTVTHNFNEIDKEGEEGVKQSTKGEKLTLKISGTRGKTESAGSFVSQKSFYQSFIQSFNDSDVALDSNLNDEKKLKAEIGKIGIQKYAKYPKPNGETRENYHSFFDDISDKNDLGALYKEEDDLVKLKKRVDQVGSRLYLHYMRSNKGPELDPNSVEDKKKREQLERANTYDKQNLFDSAHLLADWFGGSGYRKALNLNVTSAEYNRITMGDEEKEIVDEVNAKKKSDDDVIFFNLTVESRWDTLDDKAVLANITQSEIYKDLSKKDKEADKALAKQAAEKLSSLLLSKEDPKRVLGVKYYGFEMYDASNKNFTPDKPKREIGCDIWMSSYFKFDEKSKHKCMY